MKNLPEEFQQTINETFTELADKKYATEKIASLWKIPLNVGAEQLARAILFLAKGETKILDEIFDSHFYGDPRDLLVGAYEKFNEMKKNNPEGMK